MTRWLTILIGICLPSFVAAQTVFVRSGDHAGYSRLAVQFPALPDWEFGRVPGGYELRPDQTDTNYDLTTVFRRIGRNRIGEVTQRENGRLFIAVECDCHADVFEVPRAVVIDIRNGTAPENVSFEVELPATPGGVPRDASLAEDIDVVSEPPRDVPILTDLGPIRSDAFRTPFAWQDELALDLAPPIVTVPPRVPDPEREPGNTDRHAELALFQANIIAQLGRAVSQGMVETDQNRIQTALEQARAAAEAAETPTPEPDPDPLPAPESEMQAPPGLDALGDLENVRIETALDRGQSGPLPEIPMTVNGGRCISDAQLDILSWGEMLDDGTDLGAYRGRIVGEFDAADPAMIAALARHYIYLTFGLETQALINAFDSEVPDQALLLAMAEIMDEGRNRTVGPFHDQLGCDNRAAMWAALAVPTLRGQGPIAKKSILASFSEMPIHLRRHLGPWLVGRFVEIGDTRTANSLRNAVARAPGDHGDGLDMINADIALEEGDREAGAEHLQSIVAADGARAPEALIRLIDARADSDQAVDPKDRDNAAALAFANRNTALGAELKRAHIRALAHGGDPESALAELNAYADALGPDVFGNLKVEIFGIIATETPEEPFLKLVLPGPVKLGTGRIADAVRRDIAERLIGLGLAEPARVQMSDDLSVPTADDRLLYAQAYLLERRPDLMIGYLAGLESPEAKQLLARAQELAEQYDQAAATYAEINDAAGVRRSVWRGGNWQKSAALDEGVKKDAALLWTGQDAPEPDLPVAVNDGIVEQELPPPGSLAESRALLEGSQNAREILEKLLGASGVPEG